MTRLTAEAVTAIMADCLYRHDEIAGGKVPDDAVLVEGVVRKYGLHPGRLASHKAEIADLLADLPTEFQPSPEGGGGWSFLNACMDKNGRHWGEHRDMEALFVLGIATEQAAWLLPREMWDAMPGGMPYVGIKRAA